MLSCFKPKDGKKGLSPPRIQDWKTDGVWQGWVLSTAYILQSEKSMFYCFSPCLEKVLVYLLSIIHDRLRLTCLIITFQTVFG